jgi:ABC-type glycerol-3-phosphate transport system substrate-binding protein
MRRKTLAFAFGAAMLAALVAASLGTASRNAPAKNEAVSGTVTMLAVWTGAEGASFKAVLDGFKKKYPDVTVKYKSATDPAAALSTAIQGGNPPHLAALPNPGLMKDFANRKAIKPITFAKSTVANNYSQDWVNFGSVNGKLYGVFFKGANKSTVWYNVHSFKNAGVKPPKSWSQLIAAGKTLRASGATAYSIGGADGWTLTDLFENLYIRAAGPTKYDQLTTHALKWTDKSVRATLALMAQVLGDKSNIAGNPLQTDFPASVTNVFQPSKPKAAMVFEGDFVPGVAAGQTKAKAKTDYNVFPFPSVNGKGGDYVVGGGDVVTMFKDTPASRALITYLASPEAATIWAKRGGFSSPNKNVKPSAYSDDITRTTASALAKASTFRFDMSDLAPQAFGSQDEFADLQAFLKDPTNINGTAAKLEKDASAAYKKQ